MLRRAAVVAALLVAGCGGGGGPTATSTPLPPVPGDPSKLVVLDAGSFDTRVLASPRPSLVKFQLPT